MIIFTLHPAPSIESSADGKPPCRPSLQDGYGPRISRPRGDATTHPAPFRHQNHQPSQLEKDATMGDESPA